MSKAIGIMYKAMQHLNKQALVNLYYSYVYPYLTYLIETWGCTCKTQLHWTLVGIYYKKDYSYNLLFPLSRSHRAFIYVFGNFTILKSIFFIVVIFKFQHNILPLSISQLCAKNF